MKKISAILTTYNGQKTIEKTIQSILGQVGIGQDFNLELIVVDDCSNDNTFSIISQFDCIVLKNDKNSGGPNKGRNAGLKMATGDYICIVDQDDVWQSDKIKQFLPYLDKAPIITSGYWVIDSINNRKVERVKKSESGFIFYEKNKTFIDKISRNKNSQNTYLGSILFKSNLKDILFEEHFGMVDFDWILRLFYNQTSIEICKPLYIRYVGEKNLSLNESYRRYDFYYSLLSLEQYQSEYPREVNIGYKRIFGSRARYYYMIENMPKARFYFSKSDWNLKTLLYYISSYWGYRFVNKKFEVFG
jgi:glycosyltransferase involved in cell wall biosynthesis